ncbi:hypothetical protein RND71_008515 [Anisodus tanguticus]|uniref:Uncharacterized protein n=1 Tax=Anisodus tanguticus TaxID=243964 RepID=A0AAE1SR11_9SOLA|nr:hypothetical protein RND71_008515 [Anisodus tanguticus]
MALALNDLFALHRTSKDSHDEDAVVLQHLGSLRQEKNHIQTFFNEVNVERQQNVNRRNDLQEQLSKLRSLQLDNKIRELGYQHVVWELDQRGGSERLAKLENEWTDGKTGIDADNICLGFYPWIGERTEKIKELGIEEEIKVKAHINKNLEASKNQYARNAITKDKKGKCKNKKHNKINYSSATLRRSNRFKVDKSKDNKVDVNVEKEARGRK